MLKVAGLERNVSGPKQKFLDAACMVPHVNPASGTFLRVGYSDHNNPATASLGRMGSECTVLVRAPPVAIYAPWAPRLLPAPGHLLRGGVLPLF